MRYVTPPKEVIRMGHVALLRAREMLQRFGGESEEKRPHGRPRTRRE